jgi:hypothetical protein
LAADRSAAALTTSAGVLAVALAGAGAVLLLDLPRVDATAIDVQEFARESRTRILVAGYVWGVAVMAMLCFAAGLHAVLRKRSSGVANDAAFAAAVALAALQFVGWGLLLALAYRPLEAEAAHLLNDLVYLLLAYAGFPAALWTAGASWALWRSRLVRPWVAWLGVASALIHLEAAGALASGGQFSPSGFGAYLAPALISAWMGAVAVAALAPLGLPSALRSIARLASPASPNEEG